MANLGSHRSPRHGAERAGASPSQRRAWLLIALGGALAQQLPAGLPDFLVPLLRGLLFGGAIRAMQRVVKCQQCTANLGRTIAMPVAMSFGSGPKINFCPYCEVHLDEPRFVAQQQAPPQIRSNDFCKHFFSRTPFLLESSAFSAATSRRHALICRRVETSPSYDALHQEQKPRLITVD